MLRARDILERVREDFVPRLSAREGCEEDRGREDDRDYPPVSTGLIMWPHLEGLRP